MMENIEYIEKKLLGTLTSGIFELLIGAGMDASVAKERMIEIARRMDTSMHWLPMTEDAVFEDGVVYLLCDVDGSWGVAEWKTKQRCFFQSWKEPINPKYITHYARITEPNK